MGRKAKGDGRKKGGTTQTGESSQKDQPESSNPSSERTKTSTEMTTELINMTSFGKKMLENIKAIQRQPRRIRAQDQNIEPMIENIDTSGSGKEDRWCFFKEQRALDAVLGAGNLEEKIDYLALLLEMQAKALEALKSMGDDVCFPTQNACFADIKSELKRNKCKNVSIDPQKKIESLRDENCLLTKKLENVIGMLEVFEKEQAVLSGAINELKDAILISSLTKTTEMILGLSSSRAIMSDCAAPTGVAKAKTPVAKTRKRAKASGND